MFILFVLTSFPDRYITRGPNPGEIYFLGFTYTGEGLFYSTDFGETAICVDSTIYDAMRITADKTSGVIYYVTSTEALYISNDYGSQGTWEYRNSGIKLQINSGLIEGQIYSSFSKHSNDYGVNFINHNYNGFFGSKLDVEIDILENHGYVMVNQYGIYDTLYLLKSADNFENLNLHNKILIEQGYIIKLSRGVDEGELFLYKKDDYQLMYTNDFGTHWTLINNFNQVNYKFDDIVGGKSPGESYMLFRYVNFAWQDAHNYVLHSTDYGITFELFHPLKKGLEPLIANFSAKSEENTTNDISIKTIDSIYYVTGDLPLEVHFNNFSIGDIISVEWDFENDGIIDSYEIDPVHTYTDTGWYSVNMTVYNTYDTNSFLRENYIYVYELTDIDENIITDKPSFLCYPNPFKKETTIFYKIPYTCNISYKVYDATGKIIQSEQTGNTTEGNHEYILQMPVDTPGLYYVALLANGKQVSVKKVVVN